MKYLLYINQSYYKTLSKDQYLTEIETVLNNDGNFVLYYSTFSAAWVLAIEVQS